MDDNVKLDVGDVAEKLLVLMSFLTTFLVETALVDELVAEKVVENLLSMSSMSSTNCSSMRVIFCCTNVVDDMICYCCY